MDAALEILAKQATVDALSQPNAIKKVMDENFGSLGLEKELTHIDIEDARKMLQDSVHRKLKAKQEGYRKLWKEAEDDLKKLDKTRTELLEKASQPNKSTKKRGAGFSGIVSYPIRMASELGRAMASDNDAYREFASKILQDSIHGGRSAASVTQFNAEDMMKALDAKQNRKLMKAFTEEFKAEVNPHADYDSMMEHVSDLIEGYAHVPEGSARAQVRDIYREFYADAVERYLAYNPTSKLIANSKYQRRLINREAIHKALKDGGESTVLKAIAKGIRKAQWDELLTTHGEADAKALIEASAKGYVTKLQSLLNIRNVDNASSIDSLSGMGEFLGELEPEDVVKHLDSETLGRLAGEKGAKTGRPDFLKTRIRMDLDVSEGDLDLRSLFHRNAFEVANRYARETSSWMGLASQGIYTPQDMEKLLTNIHVKAKGDRKAAKQARKARSWVAQLKGVPIHEDNFMNNAISGLMSYQFITKMGAAPVMAAAEYGRAMSMYGLEATRNIPFVSQSIRRIQKMSPKEAAQYGDDLAAITQYHHQPSLDMHRYVDKAEQEAIGKFSGMMKQLANRWSRFTGMEQVDRIGRSSAAYAIHNRLIGHLLDGKPLGRLIDADYIGLDLKAQMDIQKLLKKSVRKEQGLAGQYYHVDFTQWDMETMLRYKEAIDVAARRTVQKAYLGENMFEGAHPLLQLITQFRGFGMTAIGKQFGADVAMAQKQGLSGYADLAYSWLFTSVTTVLGIEARKRLLLQDTDKDTFEKDVATYWRYHPAMGWTRDAFDGAGLAMDWTGVMEQDEWNERFGEVSRSTGLSNVGLTSTPVGGMLGKDIPNLLDDPNVKNASKLLPDAIYLRPMYSLMSD
ncbi:hypothetical protein [Vibrio sp. SCSIO 43137]|uniref:hypothetical protein n=1 Tax=Vibrio sp. SCSIO 43137 TaxID=3021011 RepID=UPI002307E527|nr:hypothetical protein [Vibrio sp. SCSIO 43137]WCE28415.1 hypothetical protein PK654_08490 [Vibrio sp. SCSIO 43137]